MTTDKFQRKFDQDDVVNQTLAEQLNHIEKTGNIATLKSLRATILKSLGFADPKIAAENLLLFGCFPPFSSGTALRATLMVLDILGIDYTYLDKEYCCGEPLINDYSETDQDVAQSASKRFAKKNREMAEYKGAAVLTYFCVGCVHFRKRYFSDEADHHLYVLDLIVDKLESKRMKLLVPKVIGYFPGCQNSYRKMTPGVVLDWKRYRRAIDRIENLKIVDLPVSCCRKKPESVVQEAVKENLDTIVCPCNGCFTNIRNAAKNRLQVKHYVEIVLSGLRSV